MHFCNICSISLCIRLISFCIIFLYICFISLIVWFFFSLCIVSKLCLSYKVCAVSKLDFATELFGNKLQLKCARGVKSPIFKCRFSACLVISRPCFTPLTNGFPCENNGPAILSQEFTKRAFVRFVWEDVKGDEQIK